MGYFVSEGLDDGVWRGLCSVSVFFGCFATYSFVTNRPVLELR